MDLIKIIYNKENYLELHISIWLFLIVLIVVGLYVLWIRRKTEMELVNLKFSIGNIGELELKPNHEDSQIAYKIWTELETRKAGQKIDLNEDIISEVYDSWYSLFQVIRNSITEIPIQKYRHNESTKKITDIALQAINQGLRPHLTKWQGKYRNWYKQNEQSLKSKSPQDLQKDYPQYEELKADLLKVNLELIEFKEEMKKLF